MNKVLTLGYQEVEPTGLAVTDIVYVLASFRLLLWSNIMLVDVGDANEIRFEVALPGL